MRITLEIPVYKSVRWQYIRIGDLPEHERPQLERWIFGKIQPLLQGYGKGVPAILDAVFLEDYETYLGNRNSPLTNPEK